MAATTHRLDAVNTGNLSVYTSTPTFTPAVGDLLVAFVVASATVDAAVYSTSAGMTFTLVTSTTKIAGDTLYFFVGNQLVTAGTAIAQTGTFDCTGDAATGMIMFVGSVSGMARSGLAAVRQTAVQANGAAAGTPGPAFSLAALTDNPVLGFVGNATNPAAMTPPSTWTELNEKGYATPTTGGEYAHKDSGFTGTTVTWGSTSATEFGAIIVELDTTAVPPPSLVMARHG